MKTIKNIVLTSALSLVFVGCAGDRYHRSTGAYIDDKATTAKVKTDLLADPMVKGTEVKVEVYQGKVQLAGFCDTMQQKERAGEVARRVNGVQWVKNDLVVKNQMPGIPYGQPVTRTTTRTTVTTTSSVNEPAGANMQGSSGPGVGAGAHVGPVGAGVNAGGGTGVGAGAHVGPVGAGVNVGGSGASGNNP
jgi:hyperosmotically inducible periplasmic protein